MKYCKGIGDWMNCLECPYLCTRLCPIERRDLSEVIKTLEEEAMSDRDQ